jgi:hypothetical protein
MGFLSDASVTPGPKGKSLAPVCALRPLWCAVAVIILSEKSIFNLRVNTVQPLLGALGSFLVGGDFRFQLRYPIFSRAKLMRKLLRRLHRVSAVLFRNACRSVQHLQDRLACFVELIGAARREVASARANGITSDSESSLPI